MTKKQIRTEIEYRKGWLANVADYLESLIMKIDDTISEIEPYEGRSELTEAQEEREQWLQNVSDFLNDKLDDLRNIVDTLEDYE